MKHVAWIFAALALSACQAPPENNSAPIAAEQQAPGPRVAAAKGEPAGHESCGGEHQPPQQQQASAGESCGGEKGGAHESCGSCAAATAGEVPDSPVVTKDPATGASMTTVGAKLSGLRAVKVADLLAKPQDYAGQKVRVEGNVSAMCGHRRAWFAVQSEDRSGSAVRVFAAPSFLVPAGSVGKKARTEGVVEVAQVGAGTRIMLRATGAEFL